MSTARAGLARINWAGLGVVVLVIVAWQIVVASGLVHLQYLPAPLDVLTAAVGQLRDGPLVPALTATLSTAILASAICAVLGFVIGALIALVLPASVLLSTSVDFLRSVPAVSLMPVLLLLLGPTFSGEVLVAVFAGLWPMLLNTVAGVRQIPARLHEVGRLLHLSRRERITKIYIPSAMPSVLVGLRLSVVTCLVVAVIAEMLINPVGIGWELVRAQQGLRPDILFAYAVIIGTIGYLINVLLTVAARTAMPGSPTLRSAR